ncbi:major capsid protein [Cupriavidus pauculus]|uniref:major capsid protein n=1 Tax=Cupriavidus pauculus TaxID=82633 RepID=UPI00147874A0|nr:major capsid protein [Cupriavidus pauculus]UAK98827.1 major capsid protein [Cupriavidus pauculus]
MISKRLNLRARLKAAANRGAVVAAGMAATTGVALAEVDAKVSSGLTTAATDIGAVAALVTLVVLAIKVGKWINRAL